MPSLFRRNSKTKITSLFREVFSEIAQKSPDATLEVTIHAAAKEAGMAEYDVEGLAERLLGIAEKAKTTMEQKKPKGPRKMGSGFGNGFQQWVGSLDNDKLLLWVADFDYQRAEFLYRNVDVDDLPVLATLKTEQTWEAMRAHFEACVIGFGGKLQGQSDTTVHEVDMSDTGSIDDMVRQMKALGF